MRSLRNDFVLNFFQTFITQRKLHIYCYKTILWGECMKDYIEERTIELARYIAEQRATVRSAAAKFHISKSTVHKDITERLERINPDLARDVSRVLMQNKSERHIRGGMATKKKYMDKRKNEI